MASVTRAAVMVRSNVKWPCHVVWVHVVGTCGDILLFVWGVHLEVARNLPAARVVIDARTHSAVGLRSHCCKVLG